MEILSQHFIQDSRQWTSQTIQLCIWLGLILHCVTNSQQHWQVISCRYLQMQLNTCTHCKMSVITTDYSWSCSYLTKTFLSCPHWRVDNLEEELTGTRIEDEDGAVDGFGRQVAFKCLQGGKEWVLSSISPRFVMSISYSIACCKKFKELVVMGIKYSSQISHNFITIPSL